MSEAAGGGIQPYEGRHDHVHVRLSDGRMATHEPYLTPSEHRISAAVADLREQLKRNFASASPGTIYWPTSEGLAVKRPGEDWQHYQRHVRRAGWYPRKPKGSRP